jgi:hypothetical protein
MLLMAQSLELNVSNPAGCTFLHTSHFLLGSLSIGYAAMGCHGLDLEIFNNAGKPERFAAYLLT